MFTKSFVNFSTTVETPTTQEFEDYFNNIDNNDDTMCAFPSNMTQVSNTVGNLKNNEAFGIDGVSAEVLITSLPRIYFSFSCFS